jgi:hypothetical protein
MAVEGAAVEKHGSGTEPGVRSARLPPPSLGRGALRACSPPFSRPPADLEIQEICHSAWAASPPSRGRPLAGITDLLNFQQCVGRVMCWRVCAAASRLQLECALASAPEFDVPLPAVRTLEIQEICHSAWAASPPSRGRPLAGVSDLLNFQRCGWAASAQGREGRVSASETAGFEWRRRRGRTRRGWNPEED